MAKTVIFAEQTFDDFAVGELGVLQSGIVFTDENAFSLVVGETYTVIWDDVEYAVTAQDASVMGEGCIALGNGSPLGLSGNNEPFAIGWSQYGVSFFVMDGDVSDSHKVGIYQDAAETPVIILKDRDGNDQQYDGGLPVRLQLSDGTTKDFVAADSVPEEVAASVELDFSAGDMEVTPDEGKVFSRVAIPTPANLIPGNIAEGVDIAGIIGTLAAGGGGGDVKAVFTKFAPTSNTPTVAHNLGAVPDLVIFFNPSSANNGYYSIGYGISAALFAKLESNADVCTNAGVGMWSGAFYTAKRTGSSSCIDVATSGIPIYNANSTDVTLGGGLISIQKSVTYHLIAISGLA